MSIAHIPYSVSFVSAGDRVAPELGLPCFMCDLCRRGSYNLCKPYSLGGFSNFIKYPHDFCHK